MRLQGKVAIITGGAQGIGAAYAFGFAKEGAKIAIADVDVARGQDTVEQLKKAKAEAIFIKTDVNQEADCNAMAKAVFDRFGTIDVLINNAAIFASIVLRPFMGVPIEEFKRVMEVNTSGPFNCVRAVFPYMKEKGGKIINISSSSIMEGVPGMPHYVASKGAVMALTRCLAKELGEFKININTIAPGYTHSEGGERVDRNSSFGLPPLEEMQVNMRSIKRAGVPEDLVGTALFLATDDSAFITGQMIVHDGGLSFH